MPRYKAKTTTYKRLKDTSNKQPRKSRLFEFTDPFPEIHGTLPEKMVYAQLTKFGIPFYFLNDFQYRDDYADFFKEYQHDIVIPDANLVIEVQGAHWHSKPTTIEADAMKFAVAEVFGRQVRAWWDFEIYNDVVGLILAEPALVALIGKKPYGELAPIKRTKIDSSKGIRTLNARKKKPYRSANRLKSSQLRKSIYSYEANR